MKKKNTKKTSSKSLALITFVCFVVVVIIAFMAISRNTKQIRLQSSSKSTPVNAPKYSEKELHTFWDLHMKRIIMEELVAGKYPIPTINNHYLVLFQEIETRYGKQFGILAITDYNIESPANVAGVDANGDPTVLMIFVPSVIDMYTLLKDSQRPTWEKEFEVFMVSVIMHELEHIAYNSSGRTPSKSQIIDEETKAWTATCFYTLSGFVENDYPLDQNDSNYYQGWSNCAGNQSCFRAFVASAYANVMDKRY